MKKFYLILTFICVMVFNLTADEVDNLGNKGVIAGRIVDSENLALPGATI